MANIERLSLMSFITNPLSVLYSSSEVKILSIKIAEVAIILLIATVIIKG